MAICLARIQETPLTELIFECGDSTCPSRESCLRYLMSPADLNEVPKHIWRLAAEDSCEYYLTLQQDELSSQG